MTDQRITPYPEDAQIIINAMDAKIGELYEAIAAKNETVANLRERLDAMADDNQKLRREILLAEQEARRAQEVVGVY